VLDGGDSAIGVYSIHRLFSHTNTIGQLPHGSEVERLVERADVGRPVTEEADGDLVVPRSCADQAAPLAIGRCAPMIA
jgi:hypothetical protein